MKKYILILTTTILILIPAYSYAQTDTKYVEDKRAIRQVIENLKNAWAAGDAVKWADQFADDVDYTVWNGMYFNGRDRNIRGHQQIFDTEYKNSEINPEIVKMRFLRGDVAIVHLKSGNERDGRQLENIPLVRPLLVLSKEKGKWRIVVFQNTPIIKEGELIVGGKTKSEKK